MDTGRIHVGGGVGEPVGGREAVGSRVGRVDERVVGDWVGVGEVDRHASVT